MAISLYDFWDRGTDILDIFSFIEKHEGLSLRESNDLKLKLAHDKIPEQCKGLTEAAYLLRRVDYAALEIKTKHRKKTLNGCMEGFCQLARETSTLTSRNKRKRGA